MLYNTTYPLFPFPLILFLSACCVLSMNEWCVFQTHGHRKQDTRDRRAEKQPWNTPVSVPPITTRYAVVLLYIVARRRWGGIPTANLKCPDRMKVTLLSR